jgi:SSS family transporter
VTALDVGVVLAYVGGIVLLSWRLAVRQVDGIDYFLAGRRMRGGVLAASIMANQASAVSLVGAPAFVALQARGGLRWLQYELALPLAMLAVIWLLLPALRSIEGASIYAFVGDRFGMLTRRLLALVFVVSRGLALGVIVYASALAVSAAFGLSTLTCILLVGGVSVLYTSMGGIAADIWSDVVQLAVLWGGTIAASVWLLAGGGTELLRAVPTVRLAALEPGWGYGPGATFEVAPMILGGLFLYMSYYGCDQSQAQRLLTADSDAAASRALTWNGLLRFPLVLTYCLFGLLLAGLLRSDPLFAAAMNGRTPDMLVPTFITSWLPAGLRGVFLAAILAAAMSSIDSALNALAAVTLEDIFGIRPSCQSAWVGRATSVFWGALAIGAAIWFGQTGRGILELINQIGSFFYGPVLAVFTLAVVNRDARQGHAIAGLLAGLGTNVGLAVLLPDLSWLWWNVTGFTVALIPGVFVGGLRALQMPRSVSPVRAVALIAGFVVMTILLVVLTRVS